VGAILAPKFSFANIDPANACEKAIFRAMALAAAAASESDGD